jgi:hypothetical protein
VPKTVPTPVAAAIGIVPTVIDSAKRVPAKVVSLPVLAVSTALTRLAEAQKAYDDLAERGERFVTHLRGNGAGAGDVQEWLTEHVPTENGAVAQVTELLDRAATKAPAKAPSKAASKAATAGKAATPDPEAPKAEPTPSAPSGAPTRHDTAATPDVVAVVEDVTSVIGAPELSHDELPLPDYDHMTLGSLRGRLRSLTVDQLVAVREYEKAHADRLPVITLVDNRIAKLAVEGGEPSPGGELPVKPQPTGKGKVTAPSGRAERTPAQRPTGKVRLT